MTQYSAERFHALLNDYEHLEKKLKNNYSKKYSDQKEEVQNLLGECAHALAESDKYPEALHWLCYERLYGTYTAGMDGRKVEKYLKIAVESGHLPSMYLLASFYSGGGDQIMAMQTRHKESVNLYRRAAATGDPYGRYTLGCVLSDYQRSEKDHAESMKIAEELIDEKHPLGFYLKGTWLLLQDKPGTCDAEEGVRILSRGVEVYETYDVKQEEKCNRMNIEYYLSRMHHTLALCLYDGAGCKPDLDKAIELMRKSASMYSYSQAYYWLFANGFWDGLHQGKYAPEGEDHTDEEDDNPDGQSDSGSASFIQLDKPLNFINFETADGQKSTWKLSPEEVKKTIAPLNDLIGLGPFKRQIEDLTAHILVNQLRKEKSLPVSGQGFHMVFSGNPGTGKTTAARMVGKIFKDLGILKKGHVVETDRAGLVGEYIGQSEHISRHKINSARDGILFIDEAYALDGKDSYKDYGQYVTATLIKAMEDMRENLVVILAGYKDEMEWFLRSNPGLRSRFAFNIDFPDFSDEEKIKIFENLCAQQSYILQPSAQEKLRNVIEQMHPEKKDKFANGRGIRNLYEETIRRQAKRIIRNNLSSEEDLVQITVADISSDHNLHTGDLVFLKST